MMNVMNYQDYDVIQDVFSAIEKQKMEEAQECLAGNFSSVVLKQTVKRDEYIEIYRRIKEGMPDAKFRIVDLSTDGESFRAKVKISGTHSKTIPSLRKGWRPMKATGKKVNAIITSVEITLRGNQIMEIRNLEANKGVIAGLLDQLQLLPKNYSVN
ncbi:MAG: ester cyclase [Ferruginibacter sp.]